MKVKCILQVNNKLEPITEVQAIQTLNPPYYGYTGVAKHQW